MSAFHALTLAGLDGAELPLAQFKDRVLLVVNEIGRASCRERV